MYEVTDFVVLEVTAADTQLSFIKRALFQAAYTAGLPLLESISYVLLSFPTGVNDKTFRTGWAKTKEDPTPKDSATVKDNEFEARRGKQTTYYLTDKEKDDLRTRQIFYVLHGGVLGSMQESLLDGVISIDLNIVYQDDQYNLQEAQTATKATVADCQNAYAAIDVKFNVIYTPGKGDASYVQADGSYGRIAQGAKEGMINVLLFANNGYHGGRSGSLYNANSEQIFIWEGSVDVAPRARNISDTLSSAAIAHELTHLFFHYAGLATEPSFWNYANQESGIRYAVNQMRYNPFFSPDPKLPDDFDYTKDLKYGGFGYMPPSGTRYKPTYEQLIRIGAKRISRNLNGKR